MWQWKGKELNTVGDIMKVVDGITTKGEAEEFMAAYRAENPHADENIGYMSGYYDTAGMQRIQQLFDVSHPVFGRSSPTPEDAFEAGKRAGELGIHGTT